MFMSVSCIRYLCVIGLLIFVFFFFFQAEDGIRDRDVTGVQCALPIFCFIDLGYSKILWVLSKVVPPQFLPHTFSSIACFFIYPVLCSTFGSHLNFTEGHLFKRSFAPLMET